MSKEKTAPPPVGAAAVLTRDVTVFGLRVAGGTLVRVVRHFSGTFGTAVKAVIVDPKHPVNRAGLCDPAVYEDADAFTQTGGTT